jgi:hypothetical protein
LTKNLLATKVVTEASSLGKFVCNTNMYHVSDSH